MKRIICVILSASLALSLCACGKQEDSENTPTPQPNETVSPSAEPTQESDSLDALGKIDVESNLFDVTLTIPAEYMDEDTTQEQLNEDAKQKGFKSVTLNEDGSATYIMTKAQHAEMMDGMKQSIDESLNDMVGSEDYPSIISIEANSDYTLYKVTLNTEEVGLYESFAVLGFYMYSGMYHVFNGTEVDNVSVQFISQSTGEIIEEANSKDMN